jgi:2-polyprenyl-3-methyl-5-hydroxy-6-metoxy-1,4-benzoquinol methylase
MYLRSEDVRLYSRNKNIVFETENQESMVNKLFTKIVAKLLSLTASPSGVVFSERIIQYALVFECLHKNRRSILDFDCVEDLLLIHLASVGYNVTGLDFQPYPLPIQILNLFR